MNKWYSCSNFMFNKLKQSSTVHVTFNKSCLLRLFTFGRGCHVSAGTLIGAFPTPGWVLLYGCCGGLLTLGWLTRQIVGTSPVVEPFNQKVVTSFWLKCSALIVWCQCHASRSSTNLSWCKGRDGEVIMTDAEQHFMHACNNPIIILVTSAILMHARLCI